jgi:predicted lysophospholipase L1 biosynthesis ABC-type transport system permease subunit
MNRLSLYFKYAYQSFRRGDVRSMLAVFSIAVGVAAVVALQTVGANVNASLTGNAQHLNQGDVSVQASGSGFTPSQYSLFARLKHQGKLVDYTPLIAVDSMAEPVGGNPSLTALQSFQGVDPSKFPFYGRITADSPNGKAISSLLRSSNDALISQATAASLHLHVGSRVAMTYAPNAGWHKQTFRVAGIVADTAFASGFATANQTVIVSYAALEPIAGKAGDAANSVFIKTSTAQQAAQLKTTLRHDLGTLPGIQTAVDLQKQNQQGSTQLTQFLTIMGLVAVVLGGIGIVNTMLVSVRRRRGEVAVLKSLGMKGRQVTVAFLLESVILGTAGSIIGIAGGLGVSVVVNNITANLMGVSLSWHAHPTPIAIGLVVGVVFTVLFSFLPLYKGLQIRPLAVIREDEEAGSLSLAKRGINALATTAMTFALAIVIGVVAGFVIGFGSVSKDVLVGVGMGVGSLVVLAVLTQCFAWLVWLLSKIPSFRSLTLRLALRNMNRQKRGLASTLLVLCIGIVSVGSIAITAQNIKSDLSSGVTKDNTFNALMVTGLTNKDQARVAAATAKLPGIKSTELAAVANGAHVVAVNGRPVQRLLAHAVATKKRGAGDASAALTGIAGRNLRTAGKLPGAMLEGRNLGPNDIGTNHVIVNPVFHTALGVKPGSVLAYSVNGKITNLKVVGVMSDRSLSFTLAPTVVDNSYLKSVGALTKKSGSYGVAYLNVDSQHLNSDVIQLRREFRGAVVVNLAAYANTFNTIIDQFAMFPEIIGALFLAAGAVIIANTVSLAMLERRKEIAVMKSIGASRRLILRQLLSENALVGLVGAAVGTVLAMGATLLVDDALFQIPVSFSAPTILGLIALGTILAAGAALLTAWPASSEKPLTVLRYQ